MLEPIYVIGHKDSDLDAIASAYAYARLLQMRGEEEAIAARHGPLGAEVRYVFERFRVDPPEAVEDLYPRVRDVMRRSVICINLEQSLLEAGQLLQEHHLHTLPVVDAKNKVHGIISAEDFSRRFFHDLNTQSVSRIALKRENLVSVLKGRVLVEGRREPGDCVLVGAMEVETMADDIEPGCLVVVGNSEDAQLKAIEHGAAALVITGGFLVSPHVLAVAQQQGVMVLSTAYHTFAVVQLVNLSVSIKEIMNRDFDSCQPEDRIREVLPKLKQCYSLPVVDEEGRLLGDLLLADILDVRPKRVILVDQNEQVQVVGGIEEADVLEIVDHHCMTDIRTNKPPLFRAEPVGSTATMIAGLYHEAGIAIPGEVAGLLLATVLYETQVLRSLKCTTRDERVAAELAEIAGEKIEKLGQEIFAVVEAEVKVRPAERLVTANLKELTVNGCTFATSTVRTAYPASIEKRSEELVSTMRRIARERNYTSFLFMIIDIINKRSTLLVSGGEQAVATTLGYPLEKDGHTIFVERLVTRKRQLIPLLPRIEAALKGNPGGL